jgi:hypothetical protein
MPSSASNQRLQHVVYLPPGAAHDALVLCNRKCCFVMPAAVLWFEGPCTAQPSQCLPLTRYFVLDLPCCSFCAGFTWQDAPAENAYLAHKRVQAFMADVLKAGGGKQGSQSGGALGRVQEWVVRYEVQNRHSLHAHIVLWVHPDDLDRVASEIVACAPAAYQGDGTVPTCPYSSAYWEVPSDPHQAALFRHVLCKQMHKCTAVGAAGCCQTGTCKYGFPWSPYQGTIPTVDRSSLRFQYHRPSWAHCNVVPYHPTLALLWGAHMNIQRINSASWSFYVLKYAMKVGCTLPLDLALVTGVSWHAHMSSMSCALPL